jgi:hypothetical protein
MVAPWPHRRGDVEFHFPAAKVQAATMSQYPGTAQGPLYGFADERSRLASTAPLDLNE